MNTTDICELRDEKAIINCLKQRFQINSIYVSNFINFVRENHVTMHLFLYFLRLTDIRGKSSHCY